MKVVGGYRSLLHDLKFLRLPRLPRPTLLLPLAPPVQRLEEPHGIVMDWTRCNLEQSDLKDPVELVIAALIAGNGSGKSRE